MDNSEALIAEAELLCAHSHFARAFALSVIAIEEALTTTEHIAAAEKAQTAIRLAQVSYNAADLLCARSLLAEREHRPRRAPYSFFGATTVTGAS